MTNKEKHFDKKSIDDTANILLELSGNDRGCGNCVLRDKYCDTKSEEDCITNIKNWLSRETQLTADEMFAELGYKRCDGCSWKWMKLSDEDYHYVTFIWIYDNKFAKWDEKEGGNKNHRLITEAEDKAIHKKIEELKKESKEENNG